VSFALHGFELGTEVTEPATHTPGFWFQVSTEPPNAHYELIPKIWMDTDCKT
jgi:hypothetical protein